MKKESVKKFDLEAAFKALDEIEIPQAKGIKANRVDLKERFGHKSATEILVEDYYDVSSAEDLKDAKEERDGEVAKAKLARIEKIVDLNAESPEELLPSYVGKVIMQCPQCMTLFYKNPEDIEPSEENPDIVNLNEPCQHCGNTSGYTLIGKVGAVTEDEADKYEEAPTKENENELNLDFGKGTEEVDAEGTGEGAEEMSDEETKEKSADETSSDKDLDLNLEEIPEEEPEEKKKEESLKESKATKQRLTVVEPGYQYKDKNGNIYTLYGDELEEDDTGITYDWDFVDDKNGDIYIKESLALKESVESEIDSIIASWGVNESLELDPATAARFTKAQLDKLTPEEIKILQDPRNREGRDKIIAKYNPKYKVNEAVKFKTTDKLCSVVLNGRQYFAGTKEECEKFIKDHKSEQAAKELGGYKLLNTAEVAINEAVKFKTTDKLCSVVLNGRQYFAGTKEECEKFIKDHESEEAAKEMGGFKLLNTAGIYVDESLTEEGDLDRLLDSDEFKTPVSEEEINAARREVAKESLKEEKEDESGDEEYEEVEIEDPEFNEDDIDELDECSLNKHIDEYLKEVYSNVKSYKTTNCELKDGKLIVEGKISFNSGKEKLTMFEFLPAYRKGKLFFEGYNKDFSEDKAFTLNCSINKSKTLITESFGYKYKINKNLVKGLK